MYSSTAACEEHARAHEIVQHVVTHFSSDIAMLTVLECLMRRAGIPRMSTLKVLQHLLRSDAVVSPRAGFRCWFIRKGF